MLPSTDLMAGLQASAGCRKPEYTRGKRQAMANTDYKSVDDYLAARPAEIRPLLKEVRKAIRKALPQAEEGISYQIPAYKIAGKNVIFFAGWKEHYAVYPAHEALVAELMAQLQLNRGKVLGPGKLVGRTIQFPLDRPVPVLLIARIARLRAKEVAELTKPASKSARNPSRRHERKTDHKPADKPARRSALMKSKRWL
jgi:uncharacterized protein YdhG (YjbR/CyaY superfamily)